MNISETYNANGTILLSTIYKGNYFKLLFPVFENKKYRERQFRKYVKEQILNLN